MPHATAPLSRRAMLGTADLAAPQAARAQAGATWPTEPIRMILPYAPGGPTDVIARLICDTLSQRLPQRVVVENRTGAGANSGASAVAHAKPDGTTFLFTNTGHAVNRALYAKLDCDPAKDLTPVTIIAKGPMVLLAPNISPDRTLAEFVARVRAKPGEYSYGHLPDVGAEKGFRYAARGPAPEGTGKTRRDTPA
jgi:tripartite-type tricarboxylate transporter receptor subunit TctC